MQDGNKPEQKRHYKLYKSGKHWVTAAIVTFGAGMAVFAGAPTATTHASENSPVAITETQPATSTATADQTTTPANDAEQQASSSTDQQAPATTQASTTETSTVEQQATSDQATTTTSETDSTTPATATTTQVATDQTAQATTTAASATTTNTDEAPTDTDAAPITDANTPPANQDTLTKGNVQGLWDEGYQGQGMIVAVIDSGVTPHPDLRLSDDSTATLTKTKAGEKIAELGYGTYVNSKIPFAYDYSNNDSVNTQNTPAGSSHGEHVAGIIAANGTTTDGATSDQYDVTDYVKGVAPEAQILAMQVIDEFPDENFNDISRAIRDAVSLGANAIQMSLGIGVTEQDLTDEEQAAVKYATDRGVFVSISAGNNGNGASIIGSDVPNDISVAYNAKNDSSLGDPGMSASGMSVAAEYSDTGDASAMAEFSSWGPTSDYTLKPDITAPGENVWSTWINTDDRTPAYQSDSGTSMAGPYDAGAALIVMQKLMKTRPELKGADLVKAVKIALMNAAEPMVDAGYPETYISPRRQGAGQIDVSKAGDLTVEAEGTDDAGSVSLNQITNDTTFTINLTNYGTTAQTYTFDADGGPLTQVIDTNNQNKVHDQAIKGATLTADTPSFTLAAGATKTLTFHLHLADSVQSDQVVEGFFTLKAADATQTISMPYLGYFGDLADEQVIDDPANKDTSIFGGGILVDNNNNPLGVADPSSLSVLVNHDNVGAFTEIPAKVENGKVSFSPNGDGVSDSVYPYVFAKQNLKSVTIEILDADGNVVRTVDQENNTTKSYEQNGNFYNNQDLGLSIDMRLDADAFTWDGTLYDQATGKFITAPDGQYTYRIVTEQYNQGDDQTQNFDLPVAVDTAAPTINHLSYQDGVVAFDYSDQGTGFTQYSDGILTIGKQEFGIALHATSDRNTGVVGFTLTDAQQAALAKSDGQLKVTLTDVAGNSGSATIQAAPETTAAESAGDATVIAPQFVWEIGPDASGHNYNRLIPESGYVQTVSAQTEFTAYGLVPVGFAGSVTPTDEMTGNTVVGEVDQATGLVTFHLTASGKYSEYQAVATLDGPEYGEYFTSPVTATSTLITFLGDGYGDYAETNLAPVAELTDNATATAKMTDTKGIANLPLRDFSSITTHAAPTEGLTFDHFNDNTFTLIGADQLADIYDATTGELTITGKLADAANKTMTYTDATQAAQTVTFGADGKFSFQVPFKAAQQQAVGYRITTTAEDGSTSTAYGQLEIYLDDIFPTLELPQAEAVKVNADGDYEITTSSYTFTISGTVNDNINGYRLFANGDSLIHQKNLAGFNNHDDPDATTSNPYGAADFTKVYALTPGDNYFTVTAQDMVGNVVTKIFHVVRKDGQVGRNDTIENGIEDGVVVRTKVQVPDAVIASAQEFYDHTKPATATTEPKPNAVDAKVQPAPKGEVTLKTLAQAKAAKAQAQSRAFATQAKAKASGTHQADQDTFPQAGEASAHGLGVAGAAILAMFGSLLAFGKRRQH